MSTEQYRGVIIRPENLPSAMRALTASFTYKRKSAAEVQTLAHAMRDAAMRNRRLTQEAQIENMLVRLGVLTDLSLYLEVTDEKRVENEQWLHALKTSRVRVQRGLESVDVQLALAHRNGRYEASLSVLTNALSNVQPAHIWENQFKDCWQVVNKGSRLNEAVAQITCGLDVEPVRVQLTLSRYQPCPRLVELSTGLLVCDALTKDVPPVLTAKITHAGDRPACLTTTQSTMRRFGRAIVTALS